MDEQTRIPNRLLKEKSPYLLQHAYNPVQWYPWGAEAFEKARQEDKPVFLSIGYSTCHWCHVMAHESFEDETVAALLNASFVAVKVDREERPDVDAVYMAVCQALTGSGGWPLTVFLTPEQKPFYVGTYFPKERRYGQPGLIELLQRIGALWRQDREALLQNGDAITAAIQQPSGGSQQEPTKELLRRAYRWLRQQFDPLWGGFGPAPKFPTPHNLLFLMEYAQLEQESEALAMAERTLQQMARGGLQDQIGGGFSRYSTDERWLAPHFEKMLYDNALLIMAYVRAYQLTGDGQYSQVARRTADYVLRELTDEQGGFYCGQDADSDGVEGKYYVLTPQEVLAVLGSEDGAALNARYDITGAGNFEGKSIPNLLKTAEPGWPAHDARLQKLYDYRRKRTALHRDDKVLLAWNSWMIVALARAGQVLQEPRYLQAAQRAQRFLARSMTDGQNRLFLRWRQGEAAHAGQLEDYGVYGLALLELYQATLDVAYLQQALLRAEQMVALFEDQQRGGYYLTANDAEQLIARPKETYDGALPSGNSVAGLLLQRLALLSGQARWQECAHRQLCFLAAQLDCAPAGHCFALLALAWALYPHQELVCVAASDQEGQMRAELEAYGQAHGGARLSVLLKTKENAALLAQCAPFTAAYPLPAAGAVYYLCQDGACRAPVDSLESLAQLV